MNQKELYQFGKETLEKANVEDIEIKAKRLLEFVLKQSREECIRNSFSEVSILQKQAYQELLKEMIQGKPLQYIIHRQEFMGLNFYVDENVLIPQPDTEVLVEQAIELIQKNSKNVFCDEENIEETRIDCEKVSMRILDLCTGSGAVTVSIAKYVQTIQHAKAHEEDRSKNNSTCDIEIVATDISEDALKIAKQNAIQNDVENQIQFIQSDMFSQLKNYDFDIIVSNPPYIETSVIPTLSKEVQQEPIIALDGGEDGLTFYQIILEQAEKYLKPNGYVLFEIGYDQENKILDLWGKLKKAGKCNLNLLTKEPIKDLGGNNRVMIFTNF